MHTPITAPLTVDQLKEMIAYVVNAVATLAQTGEPSLTVPWHDARICLVRSGGTVYIITEDAQGKALSSLECQL